MTAFLLFAEVAFNSALRKKSQVLWTTVNLMQNCPCLFGLPPSGWSWLPKPEVLAPGIVRGCHYITMGLQGQFINTGTTNRCESDTSTHRTFAGSCWPAGVSSSDSDLNQKHLRDEICRTNVQEEQFFSTPMLWDPSTVVTALGLKDSDIHTRWGWPTSLPNCFYEIIP